MRVWGTIREMLAAGHGCAAVTVVSASGSVPREAGARMVVRDDGAFRGTIGGGALEWRAIADAQALAGHGDQVVMRERALGPELGQCCGGRVRIAIESFTAGRMAEVSALAAREAAGPFVTEGRLTGRGIVRRIVEQDAATIRLEGDRLVETFGAPETQVVLFGAGHVGRALVLTLAPLDFPVTWVDPRPDAFPPAVPGRVARHVAADPAPILDAAPEGTIVLVMTHSHAFDLDIVAAALARRSIGYVGLIGSATKRARFVRRLREMGFDQANIARLSCPVGFRGITSKEPAAIALSIAVELQMIRERARSAGSGAAGGEERRWTA